MYGAKVAQNIEMLIALPSTTTMNLVQAQINTISFSTFVLKYLHNILYTQTTIIIYSNVCGFELEI